MRSNISKKMLTSLTTAALALPGIAMAKGEGIPVVKSDVQETEVSPFGEITADLKYSHERGDTKFSPIGGTSERYKIDVWQALFTVPYKAFEFSLDLQRDVQSGATSAAVSPVSFFFPTAPANLLVDSRSGATISEDRSHVGFSADYNLVDSKYGVTLYYSTEHDYEVKAAGVRGQWNFNKNNTIFTAGISYSSERFKPVVSGGEIILSRVSGDKDVQKYYISLKQDLTKYNYVQASLEYQYDHGFLDDAYKASYIYGDAITTGQARAQSLFAPGAFLPPALNAGITVARERRPSHRFLWTPLLRFVTYVPYTDGSLHFDYRYSDGSWHTRSHTFELSYYQPFLTKWEFSPRVRYYSQERAKFYAPIFDVTGGTAPFPASPLVGNQFSSDYRLAGFGTLGFEAKLSYAIFSKMTVGLLGGYYRRSSSYKIGSQDPIKHPENNGVGEKYASIDLRFKL